MRIISKRTLKTKIELTFPFGHPERTTGCSQRWTMSQFVKKADSREMEEEEEEKIV
jgi:hypothetical protein